MLSAQAVDTVLVELLQEPNPITEAASLYALTQINQQQGLAQAQRLISQPLQNDLVKDTAASLLGHIKQTSVIERLISMSEQPHYQKMTPEQVLSLVTQAKEQDITEIAYP